MESKENIINCIGKVTLEFSYDDDGDDDNHDDDDDENKLTSNICTSDFFISLAIDLSSFPGDMLSGMKNL